MIHIGAEPDQSKFQDLPEHSPHLSDPKVRRLIWGHRRGEAYVSEGVFVCRRLRFNSQYREIPEYCSAITAMDISPDGVVYAATSGDQAHVLLYDPRPPYDAVLPLGAIPGETCVRHALVWEKPGSVICGTSAGGTSAGRGPRAAGSWEGGALYRMTCEEYRVDAVQEWGRFIGRLEPLGIAVPGEGIAALVIDRARNRIYGLSDRTGIFFIYDPADGRFDRRESVDPSWHYSRHLLIAPEGQVFTTAVGGRIVRYDPQIDRIELLDAAVPTFPGRGFYSHIDAWTYEPLSGLFYIGDQEDGFIYTLDPRTLHCRLLGKPSDRIGIRALTAGLDGRVFGMAGREGDIGQFFVYEPMTRSLRNLGLPLAAVEERRYGFEFTVAVTGPQGQLYFGESERQSRLFVYFPAYASRSIVTV